MEDIGAVGSVEKDEEPLGVTNLPCFCPMPGPSCYLRVVRVGSDLMLELPGASSLDVITPNPTWVSPYFGDEAEMQVWIADNAVRLRQKILNGFYGQLPRATVLHHERALLAAHDGVTLKD